MTTYLPRPDASSETRLVFTMRELSNETARVMREISEAEQPALITMRGRFVAVITPLAEGELENKLISAALERSSAETDRFLAEDSSPQSTEELAEELGVAIPEYGDRDPSE